MDIKALFNSVQQTMDVVASSAQAGISSRKRSRLEIGFSSTVKRSGNRLPHLKSDKKLVFPKGGSPTPLLMPNTTFLSSISPVCSLSQPLVFFESRVKSASIVDPPATTLAPHTFPIESGLTNWAILQACVESEAKTSANELEERVYQLETYEQHYLLVMVYIQKENEEALAKYKADT
ncbi:hypothetical protein J1N35_024910 [Gossypium stocksii]|uniref:Uncharacterized protein n=1 Tax=Gossypium stocksii TaxID=47602 RepID=A0A9D3V586_9ROSI|nr:hypothetical protein J1N35_024910 [Gossypium stocksii]